MRHKRVRQSIVDTLRASPEGLTATQILERMPSKRRAKVTNAKHLSALMRGMKNVRKTNKTSANVMSEYTTKDLGNYQVNVYLYEEEGGEI